MVSSLTSLQGLAKGQSPGLVNYVTFLTYLFCLSLPAAFTQPADHLLAEYCMSETERGVRVVSEETTEIEDE